MGALVVGAILGYMGIKPLNELFNFIATVYTRLFQFIAVPNIALAVITTLAALGSKKETGQIFAHAVVYSSRQPAGRNCRQRHVQCTAKSWQVKLL